ncbi:hypothetical protein CC1G_01896 [Coprinopsis cinerea okayama7|uniref:Polysaccharide lyase 14 domain-containing protein n=1 Tax=Coprinopsis cinerea (strain Okayama-7 / 130 / ATCC MYA-4618 / FGSC 9003) TaxID=240176 RepID=A8N5W5_COPC7|nr:hypothetical protein CC1G_01896 [Coprinopsis cinerea okayama7\|eukprot:XP_001830260.2 hypothetical protein CC1G_01896 [Coprinopsis cinerea okayama7\
MFSFLLLAFFSVRAVGQHISPGDLAAQYSLTTSTSFPFPTATASSPDTQSLLLNEWSLGRGRIQENPNNLEFVRDPYPNSGSASSGPVLQVIYPAGSYTHASGGGAQFYNLWNTTDGSTFGTMLLSYEMAFEAGFNWVKGGKLPGLRGGLNSTGCSGGNLSTGKECFSARLMWRRAGRGEVYAYIPKSNKICDRVGVDCNEDFGISFNRGSFVMKSGEWMTLSLLVRLNDPPNVANGDIQLFYNGQRVLSEEGLQIRSADSVSINGLFFSTFFGGNSFATPRTFHTYYRNIQLWGSSAASNLTGPTISNAPSTRCSSFAVLIPALLALLVA